MRAWRRGTREMDLILGSFVDAEVKWLTGLEILALERLITENDNDLYLWVTSAQGHPEGYSGIISRLQMYHGIFPSG